MTENINTNLFNSPLYVVNIGLESFSKELEEHDVKVLHIDWSPPAGGNPELASLLSKLGV